MTLIRAEMFRKTEVSNFEDSVLKEQVLRLQVPVEIASLVDEGQTYEQLLHQTFYFLAR